uniref:Uncharacterized protein n=1 Tax=Leersia perrieri TaxID=77586 RepID=A0A0D9XTE7_9ORYZ
MWFELNMYKGQNCHVQEVRTAMYYKRFDDNRGQQTLQAIQCTNQLRLKPFDESVLLCHIATDICLFHSDGVPSTQRLTTGRTVLAL